MGAPALTKREQEVLELMTLGLANKEIAQRLSVSPRTVETHVDHVLTKLDAPSRTRAVIAAGEAGLLGGSVAGETQDAPSAPPLSKRQRFVGRRRELAALGERLQRMLDGNGSIALVGGEAGSGKSRLVAEFLATISRNRARCAVGQCLEYVQSPLAPFHTTLEWLAAQTPNVLRSKASVSSTDKLEQFNALAESFAKLAAAQPAVLVIEDIHWADSASLDFLLHLAPRLESSNLLLLITHRTEELQRGHPLRSVLAKLERFKVVARISLEPLSNAEIMDLLSETIDDRAILSSTAMNAICARAEGSPLFAEELLKTVLAGDAGAERVPATVREAVLDRLHALSERDREILVQAAVIGRRFDADFLSEISASPLAATLATLKRALDLQLIAEEVGDAVLFAFKHELTRQAIYGELLATEARHLHGRIAAALEGREPAINVAEIAYHYWIAHDVAKATLYNERAGDSAVAMFAFRDGVVNYERAIEAEVLEPPRRAALEEKLASALFSAGFGERAVQLRKKLLSFYEGNGERRRAAAVCLELARTMGLLGDTVGYAKYVERALALIEHDAADPMFFDAHLAFMALYVRWRWDPQRAKAHAKIAGEARLPRAPAAQIAFHETRMLMHIGLGESAAARVDVEAGTALARDAGDWRSALRVWANYAHAMAQTGERADAIEASARALDIIKRKRITGLTPVWTLIELALVRMTHGELKPAAELIAEARSESIEVQSLRLRLARVAIPLGIELEDEALKRCPERSALMDFALRSSNVDMVNSLSAFVELDLVQGKRLEALTLLKRALDALEAVEAHPDPGDIETLLLLVAQHGDKADLPRARTFLDRIAASSSVKATAPSVALYDAFEQLRFGDQARGVARAIAGAEMFRAIGWPLHEARALEAAGRDHEALEIFKKAGAVHDVRRLEVRGSSPRSAAHAGREMTAREQQVRDLLLQGGSNKSIAQTLALSERTVATHVSSILMKAGVRSRAELIAQLVGPPKEN